MTIFTERRLANDGLSTISEFLLEARRLCFMLEPGPHTPDHPRKPPGRYELVLRQAGRFHAAYLKTYGGDWFKGIPYILVPGRQWILAHIGNSISDTLGCSLFGSAVVSPAVSNSRHYEVSRSRDAFELVYPIIRDACLAGPCWWETLSETAPGGPQA